MNPDTYARLLDAVEAMLVEDHDCDEFYCGFGRCDDMRRRRAELEQAYLAARVAEADATDARLFAALERHSDGSVSDA